MHGRRKAKPPTGGSGNQQASLEWCLIGTQRLTQPVYSLQSPVTPWNEFFKVERRWKASRESRKMPSVGTRPLPRARQHPAKGHGQRSRGEGDCPRKKARSGAGEQEKSQGTQHSDPWALEQRGPCGSADLHVLRSQATGKV